MDFLVDAVTLLVTGGASGILGVLSGLLGTWLTKRAEWRQRQQDIEVLKLKQNHELEQRRLDAQILTQEIQGQKELAEINGRTQIETADASAFMSSQTSEPRMYSSEQGRNWFTASLFAMLDFTRGSIRPGLTIYLVILTTMMYFEFLKLMEAQGMVLPITEVTKMVMLILSTVIYLTTTSVTWWFGTRNKQKPPKII